MKIRTHVLVLCGLLTMASGAALSADEGDLRFAVPFTFSAGSKILQAGTYKLSPATLAQGVLSIHGASGGAFVLSPQPMTDIPTESPRLVFNRYGDRYFLRAVRFSDRSYALPETMQEREASTRRNGMQASNSEVVAVNAAVR